MTRCPRTPGSRLGAAAGLAVALLCLAYALVLAVGWSARPSPDAPIQDPWFTLMELLILLLAPVMVAFAVGLQAATPVERAPYARLGAAFMSQCALVTSVVHFAVLTLGGQPAFDSTGWQQQVFAFRWPSVVYALDILAWDVFFPLAVASIALALPAAGPAGKARRLLLASAAFALIGLAGVPLGDMGVRNVGIVGYVVLFPVAAWRVAVHLRRDGAERAG